MMTVLRARFTVESVGRFGNDATVLLVPDADDNTTFFEGLPKGRIELTVSNPQAANVFQVGKSYYADFVAVDEAEPLTAEQVGTKAFTAEGWRSSDRDQDWGNQPTRRASPPQPFVGEDADNPSPFTHSHRPVESVRTDEDNAAGSDAVQDGNEEAGKPEAIVVTNVPALPTVEAAPPSPGGPHISNYAMTEDHSMEGDTETSDSESVDASISPDD